VIAPEIGDVCGDTILFGGAPGVGKTWLACA